MLDSGHQLIYYAYENINHCVDSGHRGRDRSGVVVVLELVERTGPGSDNNDDAIA